MIRDFSESIKTQIINKINDKDGLYTNDISSVDLFACKNVSSSDLELYFEEICESVRKANSIVADANESVVAFVAKMNQMFNDVYRIDEDYSVQVNSYAETSTSNYISDLTTLVEAISLTKTSGSGKELTSNFGEGSIFGDSDAFADGLTDVDNKLREDVYNSLLNEAGEVEDEALAELMQQDSLTQWELEALAMVVNEAYIVEPNGLDYEGLEKFLEACYVKTIDIGLGDAYELSGAYDQFVSYYNKLVTTQIWFFNATCHDYEGLYTDEDYMKLSAISTMNALFYGVDANYEVVLAPSSNEGINIELDYTEDIYNIGWIEVSVPWGSVIEPESGLANGLMISDYSTSTCLLGQYEIGELHSQKQDPEDVYWDTIESGVTDFAIGLVTDNVFSDAVNTTLDVLTIGLDAENAMNAQIAANNQIDAAIDQQYYANLLSVVNSDYTPAYCNLVVYNGEYTIMNQHFSMEGLEQNVQNYNDNSLIDMPTEFIVQSVYYPESVILEQTEPYHDFAGNFTSQFSNTSEGTQYSEIPVSELSFFDNVIKE